MQWDYHDAGTCRSTPLTVSTWCGSCSAPPGSWAGCSEGFPTCDVAARVFAMFPQTRHHEVLLLLRRR